MAAPMDSISVLNLFQILMSPKTGSPGLKQEKGDATDERQRFDLSLQATILTFREELSKLHDASSVAQEIRTEFPHPPENCQGIRWQFVLYCLKMMTLLKASIDSAMVEFKKTQQVQVKKLGPNDAPPLSPDTLSFGQQNTVLTALQFIMCLGIVPCLEQGVGLPLEQRSGFGSILSRSEEIPEEKRSLRLLKIIRVLIKCVDSPSLGGLILSSHLGDILGALLQLCHSPVSKIRKGKDLDKLQTTSVRQGNAACNGDEPLFHSPADIGCQQISAVVPSKGTNNTGATVRSNEQLSETGETTSGINNLSQKDEEYCRSELAKILNKTYQPLVIKVLLLLQGGSGRGSSSRAPRWLVQVCGRLLSERLMQTKGVQHVLKAVLTAGGQQASWEKCDNVAKLIANCPLQSDSLDSYYSVICPQVLKLVHMKDQLMSQQILRVSCSCISAILDQHPELGNKHLIQPLLQPLLNVLSSQELDTKNSKEGAVIPVITESTLGKCIECIHKVYVIGAEPNSNIISTMGRVIDPLFKLYCFARQGVCNLKSAVEELLVTFFKQSEKCISVQYLQHVSFVEKDPAMSAMHSHVAYVPGSEGGAVAVHMVSISLEELFSESLMNQESVADATLSLLQQLKKEGLSGDYFIILLKELTAIISKPASIPVSESSSISSKQLLELETQQDTQITHLQHCLQILAILSKICETLGPDLLENTGHILSFIKATLERACSSLDSDGDAEDVFGGETLTMAFGLMSTILTDDTEKNVTAEHKQTLMDLVPLLEQISIGHSQHPIRVMATELRITVATHGTVWSENMKDTIKELRTKAQDQYLKEASKPKQTQKDKREQESTVEVQNECKHSSSTQRDKNDQKEETDNDAISKDFDEAFQELFDPLLPVRGHALMALANLLQAHDAKAMQKKDPLLKIFEENLSHEDSYIYLSAIKGLVALVDVFPKEVVPKLCTEFIGFQKEDAKHQRTVETRLKMGEALVKATRCLGELVPHYSQQLLGALLVGTRDSDASMRASSLSNLADVCQLLRFSLGPSVHEVMNCVTSLLKTDPEVEVRRACVLVITLILKGLGQSAMQVLESVMRDLYRQLKLVVTVEKDDALLLHAQLALEELNLIMKDYLFPKQTLSKKITVLS